jgi:quercetin dioxygenase-like cupin family protein
MSATTMIRKREQMQRKPFPECHGGRGALDWTNVLGRQDSAGRLIRYVHDDILPPGVSIGEHAHADNEEYYYVLSGRGVMTLDGEQHEVGPGDLTAVYPGGSHALENTGDMDMRIVVFCAGQPG